MFFVDDSNEIYYCSGGCKEEFQLNKRFDKTDNNILIIESKEQKEEDPAEVQQ